LNRIYSHSNFLWFLILLNTGLAVYATPMFDFEDAGAYISFSHTFLGDGTGDNFAHRSPFYSIVLAGFTLLFRQPAVLYKVMIFFNYALVAATAWMVYLLFRRLFSTKKMAVLAALLFNISFATIFFANLLQTEILTVFFTVLAFTLLMKIHEKEGIGYIIIYSAAIGLLSLTHYNTVPLIFTFTILLCISLFQNKKTVRKWIVSLIAFLIPCFLIINAWCFYNQQHNGFYGLFPHSGGNISRNIIVASIRPEDKVSTGNQPLLDIFVKARATYLNAEEIRTKGSLSKFDKFDFLTDLFSGFEIYSVARPKLFDYFKLPGSSGEYELSLKLSGFYQEIAKQNQGFIQKFRFISLLNGFRASSKGSLPQKYGIINLNILPAFSFMIYSIAFILLSMVVFIAFFFFIWKGIKRKWHFDFIFLGMFLIIFSYWGINFVFITAGDANRFKFPAEPFILGLSLYYIAGVWNWVTKLVGERYDKYRKLKIK